MTTESVARPRVTGRRPGAVGQLARMEGRRMLRHPAPWIGLVLMVWWTSGVVGQQQWSSADYQNLAVSFAPLLLGVSLASMSAFGREHVPVADGAPLEPERRSLARLLGGLPLVGLVAVVVAAGGVWLRVRGGVGLGDEPGHTEHAYFSLPELQQPVLLGCLAVGLGAAVVHVVRKRLVASVVLFLTWFLVGATYWLFSGVAEWLTPVQVQPSFVRVGPWDADPSRFPSDWLLSAPGQYQDYWARMVVSPSLAAWHDVYLVALTLLTVAVAVPGRLRRRLLAVGGLLAVGAVLLQATVAP